MQQNDLMDLLMLEKKIYKMCIRDSFEHVGDSVYDLAAIAHRLNGVLNEFLGGLGRLVRLRSQIAHFICHNGEALAGRTGPVSYTHLDVYKRQPHCSQIQRSGACCWKCRRHFSACLP